MHFSLILFQLLIRIFLVMISPLEIWCEVRNKMQLFVGDNIMNSCRGGNEASKSCPTYFFFLVFPPIVNSHFNLICTRNYVLHFTSHGVCKSYLLQREQRKEVLTKVYIFSIRMYELQTYVLTRTFIELTFGSCCNFYSSNQNFAKLCALRNTVWRRTLTSRNSILQF